ncbi:hypothetical protein TTRE_0000391001 [Trichuris trichiura]|uniref:Uncharacterized protein n=1 Tax=Trichuris trichiura TaxID=36087 RepID=A0A077Z5C8_TRITR|nr:hypothetical protein TTRE_0000391001 [Trichuris trichiura]
MSLISHSKSTFKKMVTLELSIAFSCASSSFEGDKNFFYVILFFQKFKSRASAIEKNLPIAIESPNKRSPNSDATRCGVSLISGRLMNSVTSPRRHKRR